MRKQRGSFPHPVVDATDDVDSIFDLANAEVHTSANQVVIHFDVELSDPELKELLDQGNASLIAKWRCGRTLQSGQLIPTVERRRQWRTRYSVTIPQESVIGKLQVEIQIVARKEMKDYWLSRQNVDYANSTFRIFPGDILGLAGTIEFSVDKTYDPMNPPLESCFRVMKGSSDLKATVSVRYENEDYVIIWVSPDYFDRFGELSIRPDLQIAVVVLPALIQVLTDIKYKEGKEEYMRLPWFRTVNQALTRLGVSGADPLIQAQMMLEEPLGQCISVQHEIEFSDGGDDE